MSAEYNQFRSDAERRIAVKEEEIETIRCVFFPPFFPSFRVHVRSVKNVIYNQFYGVTGNHSRTEGMITPATLT